MNIEKYFTRENIPIIQKSFPVRFMSRFQEKADEDLKKADDIITNWLLEIQKENLGCLEHFGLLSVGPRICGLTPHPENIRYGIDTCHAFSYMILREQGREYNLSYTLPVPTHEMVFEQIKKPAKDLNSIRAEHTNLSRMIFSENPYYSEYIHKLVGMDNENIPFSIRGDLLLSLCNFYELIRLKGQIDQSDKKILKFPQRAVSV